MNTFAELIKSLLEYLQGVSPIQLVAPHELGIKIRLGRIVKGKSSEFCGRIYEPGCHLILPWVEELHTSDMSLAAVHGPVQTVQTADGENVAFNASVRYRISDPALMYVSIYEVDDVASAALGGAATRVLSETNYTDCTPEQIQRAIYDELAHRFETWGLDLEEVCIHTLVPARVFRLLGD